MTRFVVFAPFLQGDLALENSRWVAEQNATRLGESAVVLYDADAVRARLKALGP